MTLPASGTLTIAQILTELNDSFPVTIPNDAWRTLAGKPSGSLVIPNDYWSKSAFEFLGLATGSGTSVAGVSFGGAGNSRRVMVVIHWDGSGASVPSLASCTIGGVAATIHVTNGNRNSATSELIGTAICSAVVASGTSGTVSFTVTTGTVVNSAVGSFREVRGFGSESGGSDDANSGTKPATTNINVPSNGVAIAGAALSGTVAITWPAGPSTQVYEQTVGAMRVSCLYQIGLSANPSYNVQSTWASGDHGMVLCALAHAPQ